MRGIIKRLIYFLFILYTNSNENTDVECFGSKLACEYNYSDMTFTKTRASFAVISNKDKNSIFATQILSIKEQLEGGVHAFHLTLHRDPKATDLKSKPFLCYPDCTQIRGGYLVDTLNIFYSWLNSHPSVILTIFLDNTFLIPAQDIIDAFSKAKLLQYTFPKFLLNTLSEDESGYKWPKIGKMIETDKRLVVFEEVSDSLAPKLAWVHSASTEILKIEKTADYLSGEWKCNPWRADGFNYLVEISHYANATAIVNNTLTDDIPNFENAAYMNSEQYYKHILFCKHSVSINWVNFMLVDFFGVGDIPEINNGLNSLNSTLNYFDFLPDFYENKAPLLQNFVKYIKSRSSKKHYNFFLNFLLLSFCLCFTF
ncbi:hypothetical protein BB561_006686 [Smittium simulii]|uniref:Uncharacterized protein n=1 Tax=Smittium simulii TaxID=133385 RepID=A0A2T9Y2F0_9FUNG|nr:hypothetical protein BB561_006686 [Smittium simulii]